MPCSRSARRPSVKSEKSMGPAVRFFEAFSTDDNWSSYTRCESYSSRPISVLLPSSTLPAVQMRKRSGHQKYPSRFLISIEPSWS